MFRVGVKTISLVLFFDIWLYFNLSVFSAIANKKQLCLQTMLPRFSGPSLLPSVLAYKSLNGVLHSLLLLSVAFQRQPTTSQHLLESSLSQLPTVKLQVHKVYYLPFKLPQMTFSQNRWSVHELLCILATTKDSLLPASPDCQPNVICLRFLIAIITLVLGIYFVLIIIRDLVLQFL